MKKKYIFLNIITVLFPIIFSWLIPMFILNTLNQIAQMTYNPYPRFLADSISGIILGLFMVSVFIKIQIFSCGIPGCFYHISITGN